MNPCNRQVFFMLNDKCTVIFQLNRLPQYYIAFMSLNRFISNCSHKDKAYAQVLTDHDYGTQQKMSKCIVLALYFSILNAMTMT